MGCVMAGLVRDVSDFMTAQERKETERDPEKGIRSYCRRLAGIYKSEEAIGGIPINMDGFHLFDARHRSSYPLIIAYEAAKLTEPEKADRFLYQLRYATITETRQTTRADEILRAARKTGLDEERFRKAMHDGSAEAGIRKFLQKHPLISEAEFREAFVLTREQAEKYRAFLFTGSMT